jgi:hypothetical protein
LWTVSGHTGTAGSIALFDNLGAASLLTGLAQGSVVFYDGTNWTQLAPGVAGQQLQTQGAGADPIWGAAFGATLQTAYDGGNTILSSAAEGGPVAITTTVDEVASGLTVTAGNHTVATAQTLVSLTGDAEQTGDVQAIANPGTGKALSISTTGAAQAGAAVQVDLQGTFTAGTGPDGIHIDYGTSDLSSTVFPVGLTVDMASTTIGNSTFVYGVWLTGTAGTAPAQTYGLAVTGGWDMGIVLDTGADLWMSTGAKLLFGTAGGTAQTAGIAKLEVTLVGLGLTGVLLVDESQPAIAGDKGYDFTVTAGEGGPAAAKAGGPGGDVTLNGGLGADSGAGAPDASGVGGNVILTAGIGGDGEATNPHSAKAGGVVNIDGGAGGAGAGAGLAGAGGTVNIDGGNGGAGTALTPGGAGASVTVDAGNGGADGGGGPGPDGAISVGTGTAGAITVGGAQTGAVKVSTAAGNNSAILSLSALGVAGESFAIYGGTADPTGVTSADTGSTFHRDTATGGAAYLNTSNAGSGTTWSRIVVDLTVEAKTATYNIDATNDQGRTFTNEGSAGLASARPFNLPTAVAGASFSFITQDADLLRVVAAAGDTIRLGSTVSAVAGNIESTAIGDVIELIAINATEWIARSIVGTWTVT